MDAQQAEAQRQYAAMQQNLSRGLYFLRLATEQARILAPAVATRLDGYYIPEMIRQFDRAVAIEGSSPETAAAFAALTRQGDEGVAALSKIALNVSRGSGRGSVKDEKIDSPLVQTRNPFGVIGGERRAKVVQQRDAGRKNLLLAALVEESEW